MTLAGTFCIPPPESDNPNPSQMPPSDEHPVPTAEELAAQADAMAESLNTEQQAAYTTILQSVLNNEGKAFFVDGPGGTGKSFVYKALTKRLQSLGFTI